jgi:3-mercaptopyruvate sulfurtransferase SseA
LVYPAVSHRIPGAIRIPPEPIIRGLQAARSAAEIAMYFESVPPDREVIAYCT